MLKHSLILFIRNIKKNKSSFFINIIGLSTGLACVLLIYLWVNDELKVDGFHQKDDHLYQVMQNFDRPDEIITVDYSPALLGQTLLNEFPEVEYVTSTNIIFQENQAKGILSSTDNFIDTQGMFATGDYFQVFSYPLIHGDKESVLNDINGIVLSEELARKLFGTAENIIGKDLEWESEKLKKTFKVSGVFENIPPNSTVRFDFVMNYDVLLDDNRGSREWNSDYAYTYLVLKEGTDIGNFNTKINGFLKPKHASRAKSSLFVRQYSQKYLHGNYENGVQTGGRITYIRLFSVTALFILLIASVNFMTLSTAQASRKMKEIGIKKAIGMNRRGLIFQFLGESVLMAVLSCALAVLLVMLVLPQFNVITGKQLSFNIGPEGALSIAAIVLLTGFVSGIYPAFYLSGFKPARVLKGKLRTSVNELFVRKGLVVFQLSLSAIFIAGFLIIQKQINLIQTKNLGYDQENLISFQRQGELNENDIDVFLSELRKIPGVTGASGIRGNIIKDINLNLGYSWEGSTLQDEEIVFPSPQVNYDFIETLGMELKQGRTFSRAYGDEASKLVINEAAARMIAYEDPLVNTLRGAGSRCRLSE